MIALFALLGAGASKGAEAMSSAASSNSPDSKVNETSDVASAMTMKAAATGENLIQENEAGGSQPQAKNVQNGQTNAPSSTGSYLDSLDAKD